MAEPLRILRGPFSTDDALEHEWLVTNGLGGYASGTLAGAATRRYHGLLVAALPAPLGRVMMLNHMSEELRLPDGTKVQLGDVERERAIARLSGRHRPPSYLLYPFLGWLRLNGERWIPWTPPGAPSLATFAERQSPR